MTLITPEDGTFETSDLLRSLHESILNLRQMAEDLRLRIEAGEDADPTEKSKELTRTDTLIRACQKVETCLVEQQQRQAGIAQGGYALDLDRARFEIGCRLARIRACGDT